MIAVSARLGRVVVVVVGAVLAAMLAVPATAASTSAPASAGSIVAHPFLGGGIVVKPHILHDAAVSFRIPRLHLRCRSDDPASVRIGVFGVRHHTSPRSGAVTARRWFAGIAAFCIGNKTAYRAEVDRTIASSARPGTRIVIGMSGTPCASISVEVRSAHGDGVTTGCEASSSGKSYDRTGRRILIGARVLHGNPGRDTVQIPTSINDRPVGSVPWRRLVQQRSDCHDRPIVDAATLHRRDELVKIVIG